MISVNHTSITTCFALGLATATGAWAQGCMATRVSPPMLGVNGKARYLHPGQMEASIAYRFYNAKRHFFDSNQEVVPAMAPRVERAVLDLSLTRMLNEQASLTLSVPIQEGTFDRRPINPAFSADHASGIGDIALTYRKWLYNTQDHDHFNLRLGFGLKFPTGNEEDQTNRTFNTARPGLPVVLATRRGPADVAIQPGDGGLGLIFSLEGFRDVFDHSVAYGEATYLANPRGHNGVNNQWAGPGPYVPNPVTSVPDYFLARAGLAVGAPFGWKGGSFQLGMRLEGQPVHDLIGSDIGFRRPGYTLAVEPGVTYNWKTTNNVFLTVPLTVYRRRWKSVDEEAAGRVNAVSAAFADYNILAGYTHRWN